MSWDAKSKKGRENMNFHKMCKSNNISWESG